MLSSKDFLTLAKRDYQRCLYFEKAFPDEFAVTGAAITFNKQSKKF